MQEAEQRLVRVAAISRAANEVLAFELVAADRRPLEPFSPGSHIDVHAPNGMIRQYSLCGDARDPARYVIAVKREEAGRGGSRSMHDGVEVGSALAIVGPRNFFPLHGEAAHSVFVAGGIGITPIRSMIRALDSEGRSWELHYCARSHGHAPFLEELRALAPTRVNAYLSEAPLLDARALLRDVRSDAHVYCCGPEGLMSAVRSASAHWPEGRVHFEWFAAPRAQWPANTAFEVSLARGGITLPVPADRTILQVVREHGIDVASACEEGVCGTCETAVLDGVPEHRDMLLSAQERAAGRSMMICISRSKSPKLVLDL